MPRSLIRLFVFALVFGVVACSPPPSETAATSAAGGSVAAEGGTTAGGATEPIAGTAFEAAGLGLILPEGWQQETPSSGMRAAQASIPGSAGPGQLAVFFFGPGGGGGVEANIQRWVSQMDAAVEPTRESFEQGDLRVTWLDLSGTLKASRIGSFPSTDQPDYRMLAGVVEGQGGPWFVRAVGPEATMAEQRDAFLGMMRSAERR